MHFLIFCYFLFSNICQSFQKKWMQNFQLNGIKNPYKYIFNYKQNSPRISLFWTFFNQILLNQCFQQLFQWQLYWCNQKQNILLQEYLKLVSQIITKGFIKNKIFFISFPVKTYNVKTKKERKKMKGFNPDTENQVQRNFYNSRMFGQNSFKINC